MDQPRSRSGAAPPVSWRHLRGRRPSASGCVSIGRYARRWCWYTPFWALLILFGCGAATETKAQQTPAASAYLLATPQIRDPRVPLEYAAPAASQMRVETAVVTVADPLETQLGRTFDIQLSSLIRAFHAQGYVLDGVRPSRAARIRKLVLAPSRRHQDHLRRGRLNRCGRRGAGRPSRWLFCRGSRNRWQNLDARRWRSRSGD